METAEHQCDLFHYHYKLTGHCYLLIHRLQAQGPCSAFPGVPAPHAVGVRSRWEAVPADQGVSGSGCVAQGGCGGSGHLQAERARMEVLGDHGSPVSCCPS